MEAKITQHHKNKEIEYTVDRINHLPSFQEVRLHTAQIQYPGDYTIIIDFTGKEMSEIRQHLADTGKPLRSHLPSVDDFEMAVRPDINIQ
jgi:hypothetical protein